MLKALSSVEGRIKSILIADPDPTLADRDNLPNLLWRRYEQIICDLTTHMHPDLVIYFFVSANYDLGFRNVIQAKFRERVQEEFESNCPTVHGFDAERQVHFISPMLDMEQLARESNTAMGLPQRATQEDCGPERNRISRWVQDCCFMLQGMDEEMAFVVPLYAWATCHSSSNGGLVWTWNPHALRNKLLPYQVAEHTWTSVRPTRFLFEGGNVLVANRFMVAGPDMVRSNMRLYMEDYKSFHKLMYAMRQAFGVEFIFCPGINFVPRKSEDIPPQPSSLLHLDLFMTLGGKDHNDNQLVFIGKWFNYERHNQRLEAHECEENQYLDHIAGWFSEDAAQQNNFPCRFRVVRTPLLRFGDALVTFNNCLVESSRGMRNAFLPRYTTDTHRPAELVQAEQNAEYAFREGGYKVFWVDGDFLVHARHGGSLHCMVKVLQRENV